MMEMAMADLFWLSDEQWAALERSCQRTSPERAVSMTAE
jgi:hypothetical protein